jgi:TetR/AcrR family transcriptional repressor of mexJK operon
LGRPRSEEKRAAVVEAASRRFLERGYLGTSVDEVAALAGVSKQTVYEHFGGKEQLFAAVVLETVDTVGGPFWDHLVQIEASEDPEATLAEVARELVGIVREPRLLELRRIVIAEVGRFPELARVYDERGPRRSVEALAAMLAGFAERGLLRIDDIELAAQQFNWLVLSIPINRAMFAPGLEFDEAELEHFAAEAVRVFLAAYRPNRD